MEIKLNGKRGGIAIVSNEQYALLSKSKWHQNKERYAAGNINGQKILMHRYITNAMRGSKVDHINGNTLDNRTENLRVTTRLLNNQNQHRDKSGNNYYSKYRGVSYDKKKSKYLARIIVNYKMNLLGSFYNEINAAEAIDMFIVYNKLDHIQLNFPEKREKYALEKYIPKEKKEKAVKYFGVYKQNKRFHAIIYNKKRIILPLTDDALSSAKSYDKYIVENKIFNRKLNFPEDYPEYQSMKIKTLCEDINDNTTKILISKNDEIVLIDKEDYDKIKYYKCSICKSGYVSIKINEKLYTLSRYLMNVTDEEIYVDHYNNNILDNRKKNLRLSNAELNAQNKSKRKDTTSRYIGVSYYKRVGVWRGVLSYHGKLLFSFSSPNEEMCARKRDLFIMMKLPESHYKLNFEWTEEQKQEWISKLDIINENFTARLTKTTNKKTSKYIGVNYVKHTKKWCCGIKKSYYIKLLVTKKLQPDPAISTS